MTQPNTDNNTIARLTGLAYLGIIATGIFAELGVRLPLVTPGDPGATAADIAASAGLFRAGILADTAMVSLDVAVAVGFFVLLRRASLPLALLSSALRLVQAAVIAANLMNMGRALQLATQDGGAGLGPEGPGPVLAAMELHALVYDLGLIFFGLSCLVLGRLLHRARLVPGPLALGVAVAGLVYLVGSTVAWVHPAGTAALDPLYGLAFVAELGLAGWLLVRGTPAAVPAPAAPPALA